MERALILHLGAGRAGAPKCKIPLQTDKQKVFRQANGSNRTSTKEDQENTPENLEGRRGSERNSR